MQVKIIEIPFEQVRPDLLANVASYSEPIDSYYEDHIIESKHYDIFLGKEKCGFASVFENEMLTQFALHKAHQDKAQEIFQETLRISKVKEIYLSTSDVFLLSLALEHQKEVIVQDAIFQAGVEKECRAGFVLNKAEEKDLSSIQKTDEGFFPNLEENVKKGELFIGWDGSKTVSYGIIEKSKLFKDLASIGMFVLVPERGKGYGAETLTGLISQCKNDNVRPIAGCFVKNQYSVNALKKAGMISRNRLLRIKLG
jgi:hypothetical protein